MNIALPPRGRPRRLVAVACRATFLLGVLALIRGLHEGLREGLGRLDWTAALLANAALVPQCPLVHSPLSSK